MDQRLVPGDPENSRSPYSAGPSTGSAPASLTFASESDVAVTPASWSGGAGAPYMGTDTELSEHVTAEAAAKTPAKRNDADLSGNHAERPRRASGTQSNVVGFGSASWTLQNGHRGSLTRTCRWQLVHGSNLVIDALLGSAVEYTASPAPTVAFPESKATPTDQIN